MAKAIVEDLAAAVGLPDLEVREDAFVGVRAIGDTIEVLTLHDLGGAATVRGRTSVVRRR